MSIAPCILLEFDTIHLKKAKGHIDQNIVNITMKMKTIVQMIKKVLALDKNT